MRSQRRHARLDCALFQDVEDSLVGQAANCDSATLVDVAEKRSGITATSNKPVFQGIGGTVGGITEPVFSSFGTTDREFAGFDVVVSEIQADALGTPQAGYIENGDQSGVTNSGRRRIASTCAHQCGNLAGGPKQLYNPSFPALLSLNRLASRMYRLSI